MTTAKIILTASLGLALNLILRAQPSPPPAPGQIGLSFSSTATVSGKGNLKAGDVTYRDIGIANASWAINQRIGLGGYRHLTIGLDYDQADIKADDSAAIPLPDRLQSLGASIKYFHPIDQQWMVSSSVGAGSQVAGAGLLADGWGGRASVVAIYNRSKQVTYMFGAAYNSLSQDFKLVPVFGFDWRPTEQWSLAFGFPRTGVTYKINKQVSLGLALSGAGGAFYVKDDPMPRIATRSLADSRLQYLEARLGFNCDWKINSTFRITGTLGQVLYRQFKYIDRDFKLKSNDTVPFVGLSGTISL